MQNPLSPIMLRVKCQFSSLNLNASCVESAVYMLGSELKETWAMFVHKIMTSFFLAYPSKTPPSFSGSFGGLVPQARKMVDFIREF